MERSLSDAQRKHVQGIVATLMERKRMMDDSLATLNNFVGYLREELGLSTEYILSEDATKMILRVAEEDKK